MAVAIETEGARQRGLFMRGMHLVAAYIRLHPGPFSVSVGGALLFAVASLLLTQALGRATDEVLRPAFEGGVDTRDMWLAVLALMIFGCLRALGIMIRRYYSGVSGERVAHMEADVKAAVDVFWPVPFAIGVLALVLLALLSLFRTDVWLALIGLVMFPALALMNRSFAKRMEGPARHAQESIGDVSS